MRTAASYTERCELHVSNLALEGQKQQNTASLLDIEELWTHWDLNPGPSACEADVIPLHHVPLRYKD